MFIIILLLTIYLMFIRPKRKGAEARKFSVSDIPAEGAKEGNQQQIYDRSKALADSIYKDLSGLNWNGYNSSQLAELAVSSDVFFIAVWNQFGLKDGENLREWLVSQTVIVPFSDFGKYRTTIIERIDALKLR